MSASDGHGIAGGGEATRYAVTAVRWEQERSAAAVLARAFTDDPLVVAICSAPAPERQRRMLWNFRLAVRSHCLASQPAWAVGGAPVAVALVTAAHTPLAAKSDFLFTLSSLAHIGLRTALRGLQAARIVAAHVPREPVTYLRTLGVDPDFQGRGFGSALVRQVVRTAPAALPVYLETANERNLAFYARHAFRCVGEFQCLGVRLWRLLRPAA